MTSELFDAISVLIPGYSIEDLSADLNEQHASGLLNAIVSAWHPQLISASRGIVSFRQAEIHDLPPGRQLILVPECSEDWLGHDWKETLADSASIAISGTVDRDSWVQAILAAVSEASESPVSSECDEDLAADFLALGLYHLEVMLLSRRMHHFMDPDEYLLDAEVHAAAEAWLAGDAEKTQEHLRRCFECLQETREQFHPIESFFIDLCLPGGDDTKQLRCAIEATDSISLCSSAGELAELCEADEQLCEVVRRKVADGQLCLMTGHQYELRTALGSASSLYDDIADGLSRLTKLLGPFPRHWARRRFGMTHSLPEMLTVFGFESALHVALDDGIYPDREYGQMTWQGPGRGEVPATSRIPLAIDSASTFLRFPDRFTETMQEDNSAVMLLAHLPRLNTPWLQDLRRGARYAPVLGRFVTFDEFITQTSGQGSSFRFNAGEYLSPALIQSSVLKSESPISSPAELHDWRSVLDSVASVSAVAGMLKGDTQTTENGLASLTSTLMQEETRRSDTTGPSSDGDGTDVPAPAEVAKQINDQLKQYSQQSLDVFRGLIPSQDSPGTQGMFIVNPLPHSRRHIVQWPQNLRLPKLPTKSDTVYQQDNQTFIETRLPAGGFLWLTEADATAASPVQSGKGQSLAEPYMLRNQHFEVLINEATGGIAEVRCHGRRGNRVSQQVAFRYESGKTVQDENGDDITFNYAATRMVSSRVLSSGPWQAAIETRNEIVDVTSGEVLAGFRQTISVERTAPQIDIHIEFGNPVSDVRGNPWMTYFCSRFAWDNEAASITRGLLGQACGFRAERFESPDYIEVADSDQRLLIIPHGRPYHRRSGSRMLDSLLIVEGETSRSFRFTIEIDQPFPMRTVQELRHPVLAQATTAVRPAGAATGWILGVTAKNVMLSRLRSELQNAADVSDDQTSSETEHLTSPSGRKMVILLVETEGRSTDCTIRTARKPSSAYVRTACGEISHQLEVLPEGVPIAMAGFQMQEVVLEFGTRTGSQADRAAESDRESKKN